MSVLNKYNQRVIAILGTLTIIALSIIIIITAIFMTDDFIRNRSYDSRETGITVEAEKEGETILRDQAITFRSPVRIDSARNLYAIPVSQVNLEEPETVALLGVMDADFGRKLNVPSSYSYADLNNLLIYDAAKNESTILFDKKTSIDDFTVLEVNDKPFLLIAAAQEDSNNNGLLNSADLKSLYVYDVLNKQMHQYEQAGKGLKDYERLYETSHIVARFTTDKNGDGQLDHQKEPSTVMLISLINFEAKEMVTEKQVDELQKIVD